MSLRVQTSSISDAPSYQSVERIPQRDAGHITVIGIGIILILGGVFVLLAAYQILPETVNIISQFGAWGQGAGYAFLGIGAVTVVFASFKLSRIETLPSESSAHTPNPTVKDECLFSGHQAGCNGFVSKEDASIVLENLDKDKPSCIRFNRNTITDNIAGGTCTAMSLEFLAVYFKIKQDYPAGADYQQYMFQKLRESGSKFASSSQEMRDRQAAYNAIEVVQLSEDVDYAKNKMQSLANYHGFKIDWSSNHIDTTLSEEAASAIDRLPEGAFLLRILKPANNEKLEESGHTLVYIKENGLGLFYDPNFGLEALGSSDHVPFLLNNFSYNFRQFQVNDGRFYRIQPNTYLS